VSVYTCVCTHDVLNHDSDFAGAMPCKICHCPGWTAVAGTIATPPPDAVPCEVEAPWRFTPEMHDALFAHLTDPGLLRRHGAAVTWADVVEAAVRLNFVTPVRSATAARALREAS